MLSLKNLDIVTHFHPKGKITLNVVQLRPSLSAKILPYIFLLHSNSLKNFIQAIIKAIPKYNSLTDTLNHRG